MNTVLIIGCSRGLGNALLKTFHSKGFYVFAVVRNEEDSDKLRKEYIERFEAITADLNCNDCIAQLISFAFA